MKSVHMGGRLRHTLWAGVLIAAMLAVMLPGAAFAAAPAAPAVAPSASYGGQYYYVRYGDTLSQIAVRFGTTTHAIMQANGIYNPNHIYVGQKLYIPGGHDGGYYPGTGGQKCQAYHVVRFGQTASQIAVYYGISTHALIRANGIVNPNHIYVGQKLCIPGGHYDPQPPVVHPKPPKPHPPKPTYPTYPPSDGCYYHQVQRGDTLSKIAYRHGVSVQYLMQLNGIYNPNRIEVGQWIKISCDSYDPHPPKPKPPVVHPPHPCHPEPEPCHPPKPKPPVVHPPHPCPTHPDPCHPPKDGDWYGEYFSNKYFEGHPTFTQRDYDIHFNWYGGSPNGLPNDRFSIRWTKTDYFSAGKYRFTATSDDGVRIYVDGRLILDGWREQPATTFECEVYIGEGHHEIRVEYFEEAGDASITVRWGRLY